MAPVLPDEVVAAAERILGSPVEAAPTRQRGYRNENWRVLVGGRPYLVKISPPELDIAKVTAASNAYRLAATTPAPVPRQLHFDPACRLLGGRPVRILEFRPGTHVRPELTGAASARFFASLGRSVAQLHTARCKAFTSRIGGDEPGFPTWLDYLEYRIPQIIARNRSVEAFDESELRRMFDHVLALAARVSELVEPRLCHRDLYLDNFLVGDDGLVAAILDLDLAEAWDPAVDFVKLRSQVFPLFPGADTAFAEGYAEVAGGPLPAFAERVHIVEVLELSNHVINATATGNREYAMHNRRRLEAVLGT